MGGSPLPRNEGIRPPSARVDVRYRDGRVLRDVDPASCRWSLTGHASGPDPDIEHWQPCRDREERITAARAKMDADCAPVDSPDVPAGLVAGLDRLRKMPFPRGAAPEAWSTVVADAHRLVREGWVTKALAIDWSPLDLFGIGPNDSWEFSGLAVWLQARRLAHVDRYVAIATNGATRACFNRGGIGHGKQPEVEPVFLWQFGRA